MSRRGSTPLGAIAGGLLAGGMGTAAMDALLFSRYRRDGGERSFRDWEFSTGLTSWEDAPAPAHVGKRLFETLTGRGLSPDRAALVNNVTHWAFGIANGAQYGILAGSIRSPRIRYGLPSGASVWGAGYIVLPVMNLYQPIWEYDRKTLSKDLSAHLVLGLSALLAASAPRCVRLSRLGPATRGHRRRPTRLTRAGVRPSHQGPTWGIHRRFGGVAATRLVKTHRPT